MMDHQWLIKFLGHRIADKTILTLIKRWLKAGVMEDGKLVRSSSGSPLHKDAVRFHEALKKRLGKFNLKLNEKKTKLCRFGKFAKRDYLLKNEHRATFNFLGFTFYNKTSRNGKYTVGTRTESKRLSVAMNRVTIWCKENRHQAISWQARYLNSMSRGHYHYYGVTSNFPSVAAFYRHCTKMWKRYLSKRSQRASIDW